MLMSPLSLRFSHLTWRVQVKEISMMYSQKSAPYDIAIAIAIAKTTCLEFRVNAIDGDILVDRRRQQG